MRAKDMISSLMTGAALLGVVGVELFESHEYKVRYDKELSCLAYNIYHEARGESIPGQLAVAHVTINRAKNDYFPDTICEVVWQPNQFSWTNDGKSDAAKDRLSFSTAIRIAESAMNSRAEDNTNGSLFYHADYVSPNWAKHKSMTAYNTIGQHIFYNWTGTWN